MKKILLAGVLTALALPALAVETTTITTTSPEVMSTTTTTTLEAQKMEEEAAPTSEPTTAPAVDALPETGEGFLDQQRMEDPASAPQTAPNTMDDPSVEDESGEFVPKIDDVENGQDIE